jgi:antitoxin VapB
VETIKLTINGNSQVVVLPEQFHLSGSEIYIKKMGNAIVLISKEDPWRSLLESLEQFSDDFMDVREQLPLQSREELFE